MKARHLAAVALLAGGCGTATLDLTTLSEEERIARAEHQLGARLKDQFGPDARISRVVPQGNQVVVAVATEPAPIDGDALPPVGFAVHDPKADALHVLAGDVHFREARLHGDAAALVTDEGQLQLVKDGAARVLAERVRGDVAFLPSGDRALVTLMGETMADGETGVALVDLEGQLTVLADAEGVDDRPAVSPDGRTVVFVSGRTGVASFFRTSLDGEAPVQLTNAGIEPGGGEGEGEPAGFVPPPVNADQLEWLDADTLRFDAGAGELWTLNVRTGAAAPVGGAR